jgi:peptide/nickel transport system substrate-binding protein
MRTAMLLSACLFSAALAFPTGAAEPRRGGVLHWAIAAEPPTYDLHGAETFAVLQRVAPHYSFLLKFEPGNYPNIVGDLAESWTVAPDQLTYTFKLHPNVKFHDGTSLTSEDVKATYDRLMSPPPGIVAYRQVSLAKVKGVEAPDPTTIVFRMKEVDSSIMTTFASPWNAIYSAARLKADPSFPARNIMGSGPFKFVEHVAGSHWVGERFEGYFRKDRPYLDGFRSITMGTSARITAMAGKQVMAEFRGFSPPERDRVVRELGAQAQVHESPWLLHMLLTFNTTKKPFDDPRVRRALSLAVDRWTGAQALGKISTLGVVGGMLMPAGQWSATEAEMLQWPGYGKDIEKNRAEAKRLLKEAGAENLSFVLTNRNIVPYGEIGVFLVDQWRRIGVTAEHRQLETAPWTAARATAEATIDAFTDFADDATSGLAKYVSADKSPVVMSHAIDRKLDELYEQQARTSDKAARLKLIREFETHALNQAYAIPLLWWKRTVVTNTRVNGWTMSPSHMLYQTLADVWLTPE